MMTSGWSMTLKIKPDLIKMQVFLKKLSLMWNHYLFMASYLHPNTSQSPRGNHLEIFTMREASRVSYDDQKVAKTEQKAGFKENFNHNSRQNSFDQLWLTCNYSRDSRGCLPLKLSLMRCLLRALGTQNSA